MVVIAIVSVPCEWSCDIIFRLKEGLAKASGATAENGRDSEGKDGAENEFVRASKEKFSEAKQAVAENSVFSKLR